MIPDDELAAMRERVRICHETCTVYSSGAAVRDVPILLDEIDRLKERVHVSFAMLNDEFESNRELRSEIDRFKAELAATEIRWTDARPTTLGWYWWRVVPTPRYVESPRAMHVYRDHTGCVAVNGSLLEDWNDGEWSDRPIPLPKEAI